MMVNGAEQRLDGSAVAQRWTTLWNGDFTLARRILAGDFRIHFGAALPETDAIRGPEEMAGFIGRWRDTHEGIAFAVRGTPLTDAGRVALLWDVTRTAHPTKSGIDVLELQDGLIVEVWSVTGDRSFGSDLASFPS